MAALTAATSRLLWLVLIQPMVQADEHWRGLQCGSITGDRNTAVVDAVRASAIDWFQGEASPDHWLVRGTQASCQAAPEGDCARSPRPGAGNAA
jgi:hypothetical protein